MFSAGRAALPGRSPLLVPVLLFAASAAFTFWRNTQVAVLVDIAYVLNTATRIAAGDVPYAQFPLVLAPGEFLIQALLIKAFGPHFLVQIAYATILGGLATVFTYAIARRLSRVNPPLTPPRRGTDRTRTDACSPPGRGRGWVGSWKLVHIQAGRTKGLFKNNFRFWRERRLARCEARGGSIPASGL